MSPAPSIGVLATGTCLPERILTNDEVAEAAGVDPEWIVQRTGVLRRHIAEPAQAASDLAAEAVRKALTAAGLPASALGLLILATSTPDELGPSTACRVQALVGADQAVAFDVAAACSGWLFAARVAHDWLRSGTGERYAVVVGVEVYSRFVDPADRATAVLFADGAAATILGSVQGGKGFASIRLGSDGTAAGDVLIPAGGSRLPASPQTLADRRHKVHMDGKAVRDFILRIFPKVLGDALTRNGLRLTDIDLLISHQPNPLLLRRAALDAGVPEDRVVIVGHEIGNIGAASIPYALATADHDGRLRPGSRVLVTAFGAGLTWGSTVLTWTRAQRRGVVPAPRTEAPRRQAPGVEVPRTEVPREEVPSAEVPGAEVPRIEASRWEALGVEVPPAEVPRAEVPSAGVPSVEVPRTEASRREVPSVEVPRAEAPRREASGVEVPCTEVPRTDAPRVEVPCTEVPRTDAPRAEVPGAEAPRTQAPRAGASGTEAPRTEIPRPDVRRWEAPRREASGAGVPDTDVPRAEVSGTELSPAEAPRRQAPSVEVPRTEAPHAEVPGAEAPRSQAPRAGASRAEASRAEIPRPDAPSPDASSTETPRTDAPGTKAPRTKAPHTEGAQL
ncbi:beta-ketoacyl-ACP synthase 3 [Streptomyces sp. NPDC050528]|uniref:beta-ketoacyl-ACP synthase 3 n=1 Tax=Streptomyces sp. NPDC050528 TaxID=3365623 RepID=UPI00379BB81F